MGRVFCWLDHNPLESTGEYDNRINQLPALHAGYAYFLWENYDKINKNCSVYAVWNGELNSKLCDTMPQGGYLVSCDDKEAFDFCKNSTGIPIYMKLCSKQGKLYAGEMYVLKNQIKYEFFFTGCEVIEPDMVYFFGYHDTFPDQKEDCKDKPEVYNQDINCSHKRNGSYRKQSSLNIQGSYRKQNILSIQGSYRKQESNGIGSGYRIQGSYLKSDMHHNTSSYRNISSYRCANVSQRNIWFGDMQGKLNANSDNLGYGINLI